MLNQSNQSNHKKSKKSKKCFKYKEFVDLDNITTLPEVMHRFKLNIPFIKTVGNEKNVTVILHNPSLANRHFSDSTINNVLAFLYEKGYTNVCILNLTPIYGDEVMLNDFIAQIKEFYDMNIEIIRETIKTSDDIVLAWGNSDCNDSVKSVLDMTKEKIYELLLQTDKPCFTFGEELTNNGNPYHPVRKSLPSLDLVRKKIIKENDKYVLQQYP